MNQNMNRKTSRSRLPIAPEANPQTGSSQSRPSAAVFPWYLASSSLWLGAMSLQGFLITWLLVGILETPPEAVGAGRALIELPGLVILLLGGLIADRMDGRSLLLRMHLAVALPALVIAGVVFLDLLHYWWVIGFGIAVSIAQALTDPARQSMLSRVSRLDIQRTITITTIVTSLVGIAGVGIGGMLERIGLASVLGIQSLLFLLGGLAVMKLPPMPGNRKRPEGQYSISSNLTEMMSGLRAVWTLPLIRNLIGLNFLSSLFNAGAYVIVVPFIATAVYSGDAAFYANIVMMFTAGAVGSNILLLYFMPLAHPGRLFLLMQLTRVIILLVLWTKPPLWLFYTCMIVWGLNMGITSTLVRTTVQELAPTSHRARILSLLILSFMLSAPLSSLLLGKLVGGLDPLNALLPGVAISLIIFLLGRAFSGLWQYRSAFTAGTHHRE